MKITVPTGSTLILQSLASKLGFAVDATLGAGEHISTSIANINPVQFVNCNCSLVDINSTRSNSFVRPIIRSALLPECLEAYQFFDLCRVSDDYRVRSVRHEISTISIRLTDQDGNTLKLNPDLKTHFTIIINEL